MAAALPKTVAAALVFALITSASTTTSAEDLSIRGSNDLVVVVPEKFQPREYFSPRKFPNLPGREYPSGTFSLIVESHPARWLKLYSLSLMNVDGTALNTKGGIYNFDDVFQHRLYGAKFEEAYADLKLGAFSLKTGIQKFAWGKLDALAPNDIVNPLEFNDPLLSGLAGIRDSEIGIPAVQAGYDFARASGGILPSESSLQAIWIPFYVPPRFDNIGERWFPPTVQSQKELNANGIPIDLHMALQNSPPPSRRFNNPLLGTRFSSSWSALDLDFYYYYGYQTGFRASGDVQLSPSIPPQLFPPALLRGDVDVRVRPLFKRFQSVGMAAAMPIGPFGFRAEVAFRKNNLFGRDLSSALASPFTIDQIVAAATALGRRAQLSIPPVMEARDSLESGLSLDYSLKGYFLLMQINQTDIYGSSKGLISKSADTRIIGTVRKTFFRERVPFALSALYSIEGGYSFLEPTFGYVFNDSWSATLGYVKIAGPSKSLLGQFHDNDEGFLRLRFSF